MLNFIRKLFSSGSGGEAAALLRDGARVIDVRTPHEFRDGHVEGSVNIPLDQLPGALHKIIAENRAVVFCCASGMRSGRATTMLKNAGFEKTANGGPWNFLGDTK